MTPPFRTTGLLPRLVGALLLLLLLLGAWAAAHAAAATADAPRLVVQTGHQGPILKAAFAPDGKTLVAADYDGPSRLWHVASGRELRTYLSTGKAVRALAFAPDGRLFAEGDEQGQIRLWAVDSGQLLRSLSGHQRAVNALIFSADGGQLISGDSQGVIKQWDLTSGRELWSDGQPGYGLSITALSLSPDGVTLAAATSSNLVRLRVAATGAAQSSIRGHGTGRLMGDGINAVRYSPDGQLIATAGRDKLIKLWNASTRAEVRTLAGHTAAVESLDFSPDGRTLISGGGDGTSRLWDLATGTLRETWADAEERPVSHGATSFSPDGRLAFVGGRRNALRVVAGGALLGELLGGGRAVDTIALDAAGRTLLVAGEQSGLWGLKSGQLEAQLPQFLRGLSSDGQQGFALDDCCLRRWDLATGKELSAFSLKPAKGFATYVSPKTEMGHVEITDEPLRVAFSPDGRRLLAGYKHGGLGLWDLHTGRPLLELKGHATDKDIHEVLAVAISPDGKTLASSSRDDTVRLWDAASGRALQVLRGHGSSAHGLAFSADGRELASSGEQGMVMLWTVATGERRCMMSGHSAAVFSLAQVPGRALLASASLDRSIKLWDTRSCSLVRSLEAHEGSVFQVAAMPDGRHLVSGGEDRTLRFWRLEDGALLATAVSFEDGQWAVVDPLGRFDTSDLEEVRGLHWVLPDAPRQPVALELFMRDYYEPRLLPRLLKGERFKPVRPWNSLDLRQPGLRIVSVEPARAAGQGVSVTVEVEAQQAGKAFDLKLFRDGQLVGSAPPDGGALLLDKSGRAQLRFEGIQLAQPAEAGAAVDFTAYAFNADRVKSGTARASYSPPPAPVAAAAKKQRRAYVITIGVNAYDNPLLNLRFAANDAQSLSHALERRLRARGDFEEVILVPLISRAPLAEAGAFGAASKRNIRAALDLLAGRPVTPAQRAELPNAERLRKATPDDVVFMSFSGHGFYELGGDFFLLPSDIGPGQGREPTDAVLRASISSEELSAWLRDVDGGRMALVIDACHSGAVVGADFKPGPMGSRGLGQLAFDKGMLVLAATQAENVALEADELEHGFLSYALVQEGLLAGQADFKPRDGRIAFDEWMSYAVERVPRLAREIDSGSFQRPERPEARGVRSVRRDVGGTAVGELDEEVQQPTLFQFKRRHKASEGRELLLQ